MALISNARNVGQKLNLSNIRVDIEYTSFLSDYFILSEYNPKFTAGKNTFLLNGSNKLASNTPIQVEGLDVVGVVVDLGKQLRGKRFHEVIPILSMVKSIQLTLFRQIARS
jgi:hypothetical protein